MKTSEVVRVKEIEKLFSRPSNYDEIKADIDNRGIQRRIIVNAENELLGGYTRLDIALELGLDKIPHKEVDITDFDDMIEYAWKDNKNRRHQTDLEWAKTGARYEKILSRRHGGDRRSEDFQGDHNEHIEKGKSRDLAADKLQTTTGNKWSGSKLDRLKKISTTAPEVQVAFENHLITQKDALALTKVDHTEQVEILQSGYSNIPRKVNKVLKEHAKQKVKDQGKDFEPIPDVEILCGDVAKVGKEIKDNSVDLILTDPPYSEKFLYCWESLAEFADRVLKEGGFLVSYSAHRHLDRVMSILSKELEYYWIIPLLHNGHTKLEHSRHVTCTYKPILVYAKPKVKPVVDYFKDTIQGSGRSKSLHEWQQGLDELYPLIETFSDKNDLIVDPFAGSGTTLIAAHKKGRRTIGIEKNEETVKIIKGRLSNLSKIEK